MDNDPSDGERHGSYAVPFSALQISPSMRREDGRKAVLSSCLWRFIFRGIGAEAAFHEDGDKGDQRERGNQAGIEEHVGGRYTGCRPPQPG